MNDVSETMPSDSELQRRGQLVRSLGRWREMLPGTLVVRYRKCGKPTCRCARGQNLHLQRQLSVLLDGKLKTIHIPDELVQQVQERVEMRRRFEQAAAAISHLNLRRLVRRKKEKQEPG